MLAKSSSAQSRGRKSRIGGSAMRGCWKRRREALFDPSRRTTQEFLLEMPAGGDDSLFEGHRNERLLGTGPLDRQGEDHDRNVVSSGEFLDPRCLNRLSAPISAGRPGDEKALQKLTLL